jgi:hypothetical protein
MKNLEFRLASLAGNNNLEMYNVKGVDSKGQSTPQEPLEGYLRYIHEAQVQ